MLHLDAQTHEGKASAVKLDKLPDHCPLCHYGIEAKLQNKAHVIEGYRGRLEVVLRCPREGCQSFFVARYKMSTYPGTSYFVFVGAAPCEPLDAEFSESMRKISPNFCEIANQAQKAEYQEWKLVAGPGYRKALEFLVRDYLCRARPADDGKIKNMQLGGCIASFVDNDKVREMAKRAAWLGNDETHYTRKWEDKDLEDLKKLIQLTVHWIEMEEMTTSVVEEMPEGKK